MSVETLFRRAFGAPPALVRFSPGRVNLIGEHTDYNGGAVLPAALSLGVSLALSPSAEDTLTIVSDGFEDRVTRRLDEGASGHWSDYALGALRLARENGLAEGGLRLAVASDLPIGAGLSSSSALIVGILKALRQRARTPHTDAQIAHLARRVETDFIGMPCGIMDQMVIAVAQPGEALFLDTHTMESDTRALPDDPVFAILHSGVYRALADGRYKVRKTECDRVRELLGRDDICRAGLSDLAKLEDDTLRRRARHCVTEHRRTLEAADALARRDDLRFGRLMQDSHASMRDDFAITTPGIDALVQSCVELGALGARMTGGGFGGCVVALVERERRAAWLSAVLARHDAAFEVA